MDSLLIVSWRVMGDNLDGFLDFGGQARRSRSGHDVTLAECCDGQRTRETHSPSQPQNGRRKRRECLQPLGRRWERGRRGESKEWGNPLAGEAAWSFGCLPTIGGPWGDVRSDLVLMRKHVLRPHIRAPNKAVHLL